MSDSERGTEQWWDDGRPSSVAPATSGDVAATGPPGVKGKPLAGGDQADADRRRKRPLIAGAAVVATTIVVAGVLAASLLGSEGRDQADTVARDGPRSNGSADRDADDGTAGNGRPMETSASRDEDDQPDDAATDAPVAGEELSCGRSGELAIPGTEISVEPLSRAQEVEIGNEAMSEILRYYTPSDDDVTEQSLDDLLGQLDPDTPGIRYSVELVESGEINAFALPGGSLLFTTGIVDFLDDGELAFVMAHEIAHVACRHTAKQIERETLVVAGLHALVGDTIDVEQLYESEGGRIVSQLGSLSFTRRDESEADAVGVSLMRAADVDPNAAVAALQALRSLEADVEQSPAEVLLSTHPPTDERIADVQVIVGE